MVAAFVPIAGEVTRLGLVISQRLATCGGINSRPAARARVSLSLRMDIITARGFLTVVSAMSSARYCNDHVALPSAMRARIPLVAR